VKLGRDMACGRLAPCEVCRFAGARCVNHRAGLAGATVTIPDTAESPPPPGPDAPATEPDTDPTPPPAEPAAAATSFRAAMSARRCLPCKRFGASCAVSVRWI